ASAELRSEPWIVAQIGQALLGALAPWTAFADNYDRIRDKIGEVIPAFASFNERVRTADGFQLPNSARDGTLSGVGGRARFTVWPLPDLAIRPGRLRMMTFRSHDQYNTTIYALD